jgi:hypothetical protein
MPVLVVYESMFGDNQRVAEAIAEGSRTAGLPAATLEVSAAPAELPAETALLVVGAPNHGFSLPRPSTRADAAGQVDGPVVSQGTGVREWLGQLRLPPGQPVAAFDTRMSAPKVLVKLDHASRQIEKGLAAAGGRPVAPAEHFQVADTHGPLAEGEYERAVAWGTALARAIG